MLGDLEADEARVREDLTRRILHRINELFSRDTRGLDTTRIQDDFFKSAFFEAEDYT